MLRHELLETIVADVVGFEGTSALFVALAALVALLTLVALPKRTCIVVA